MSNQIDFTNEPVDLFNRPPIPCATHFTDVIVEDKTFVVVTHVLINASEYFKRTLVDSLITLNDVRAEDFEILIRFLYRNADIPVTKSEDISKLAERFDMPEVAEYCKNLS